MRYMTLSVLWKAGKNLAPTLLHSRFLFHPHFYSLAAILISDFTLDLRQQNLARAEITINDITLPRIHSFKTILQHMDQSILIEMGDGENIDMGSSDIPLESSS